MEWVVLIGVLVVSGIAWTGVVRYRRNNKNEFYMEIKHRLGSMPVDGQKSFRVAKPGMISFSGGKSVREIRNIERRLVSPEFKKKLSNQ